MDSSEPKGINYKRPPGGFSYLPRINNVSLLLNQLVGLFLNDRINVIYTLYNSFHPGRKWPSVFSGELCKHLDNLELF